LSISAPASSQDREINSLDLQKLNRVQAFFVFATWHGDFFGACDCCRSRL